MSRENIIITAYGLIVWNNSLLVTNENNRRGWKLPGGWINPGESIEEGLTREIAEELGVRLQPTKFVGFWQYITQHDHRLRFNYLMETAKLPEVIVDGKEVLSVEWVNKRDPSLREVKRFFRPYFFEPVLAWLEGNASDIAQARRIIRG